LPLKPCFGVVPAKQIALHASHEKLAQKLQEPDAERKVGKYLTVNESACTDLEEVIPADLAQQLFGFFIDRLSVQLKDQGIRSDVIKAVTASGDDDLVRIVARAKAVQDFLNTENGKNLLIAYRRAANIVQIEEKKDKVTYTSDALNPKSLIEEEEKALSMMLGVSAQVIEEASETEDFEEMMNELSTLRGTIDLFFEKVMVNCDNTSLRIERLRLLARIRDTMDNIADFALIEG
jgi:glycyl-tRNA synthetase beta chain